MRLPRFLRPRYNLRVLLLAITVLAIVLGLELGAVRQRQALLRLMEQHGGGIADESVRNRTRLPGVTPHHISRFRELLGDHGIWMLFLPESLEPMKGEFVSAFPEAEVICISDHPPSEIVSRAIFRISN